MADYAPVVRDFTIPLNCYPHLNEKQTLKDAVEQIKSFVVGENDRIRYSCLLIVNDNNQLVGRVSLEDIIHALAPRMLDATKVKKFEGKESDFPNLAILMEDSFFKDCRKQSEVPISSFMGKIPTFLNADTPLLKALAIMLNVDNKTLPVVDSEKIIGVLRLEEVFAEITSKCQI